MVSWRTSWWYVLSFWQKYKKMVILGAVLGVAFVWFFPRVIVLLPQQKPTQYIGRVGLFGWLDLPRDIQEKMSAGLTTVTLTGEAVPVLADRWSIEEDGKVFRFLLKKGLRWQDGKPFESGDVQYNFSDVQVIRTENEVLFRLNDAYSPFANVVSQPLFRQVQERQFGFLRRTKLIGLGEYSVVKLKNNGPYVRELIVENARERLVYRFYASEQEALVAFRLGQVDTLEHLADFSGFAERDRRLVEITETVNPRQFVAVYFNTENPMLSREMRQALNFATKKPGAQDDRLRALTPIPPTSWAYNATNEIPDFSQNYDQALAEFAKVKPAQPTELTLDAAVALLDEAQVVANDWQELGRLAEEKCQQGKFGQSEKKDKTANGENTECSRFRIKVNVRVVHDLQDYQAVIIGREAPADPDQYTWWHSNQGSNITQYQNPRIDKLLEDARKEPDQVKRKLLYFEFQRYLVEDVPAIFLYYVPEYFVTRKNYF